jgi:cell division protein FtsI/penicillin-binding protein 2
MRMRGRVTIAAGVALLGWLLLSLLPASGGDEQGAAPATPEVAAGQPAAPAPGPARRPNQPGGVDPSLLAAPTARDVFSDLHVVDGALEREVATTQGGLKLRYTLDPELSEAVWKSLERGRFPMAHVVVMEPRTGTVLAYASTDTVRFPPDKTYPAASLVKVITAAATLDRAPQAAHEACRFVGSPWRLTRDRLEAPRKGNEVDMRKALATSNNQCFARWAVRSVGPNALLDAIDRFGMLTTPALGHPEGRAYDPGEDPYALGKLGSGLDGLQITPLHAAQLAATLVDGELVEPRWLAAAWDEQGRSVPLPQGGASRRVLTPQLASQLRSWMVDTTVRGTARRAFRTRGGRPLLDGIPVSGKTGSLNGTDPKGHYEWFIGVAPAGDPKLVVATVAVQGKRWWWSASQLAADVLRSAFCPKGRCSAEAADRFVSRAGAEPTRAPQQLAQPATRG